VKTLFPLETNDQLEIFVVTWKRSFLWKQTIS